VDPEVANFGVVVAIIVATLVTLAPLTLWFVRGLKKNSQPRALPNSMQIEQRFDLRRRNAEIADADHLAMLCTRRRSGVCAAGILHCSSPPIFTRSRSFPAY